MKQWVAVTAAVLLVGCTSSDEKARTLYNQALTLEREGKPVEARVKLEQVAKEYPQTEIATEANRLLKISADSMAENEEAAIAWMRTINTACVTFLSLNKGLFPVNLLELVAQDLVPADLLHDKAGYKFELHSNDKGENFETTAVPVVPNVGGRRYFFSGSKDFVVRFEVGKPAGPDSSPVEEN